MLTRRCLFALSIPLTLGTLGTLGALSIEAHAQGPKPRVEIIVLYAKKDPNGGHVGPGVPHLPQLSQPPFNAYNTFTLESQATLTLEEAKPDDPWKGRPSATYALANGKPLRIAMIEQLPDKRFHMGATIGKDAPDVVRWDAPRNEPVFIAGQSYKDGILVIGITLHEP
jgi:hypothetical protein